jgi:uncharacterized Fe-S center protein
MSEVFLAPARYDDPDQRLIAAVDTLWERAGLDSVFESGHLAALKLHVGEPGCQTFVRPTVAAALAARMKGTGAQPFLTDTCVLYKSRRNNGISHARVAIEHGFGIDEVGAPFVAADGLTGSDEVDVGVGGQHYAVVAVASAIAHARSMLVLSHVTGHLATGLAAALKNLGMGCASKKAKLRQHHGQQPRIAAAECTACGECAEWCPSDAIDVGDHAEIDNLHCIGCGECVAVCPVSAVKFDWLAMGRELQERIVEHAAGVVQAKPGRIGYLTAAFAITKDCDCMSTVQQPLIEDIGLLAATDPVAIDQAVLDLVRQRAGQGLESLSYPEQDAAIQLGYAEELGLGSREYDLIEVEP